MAVGNGVAFVIAGIATVSLIALLRKLRGGGESTEMKCGEKVVEKVDRKGDMATPRQSCAGCPDCQIRITPDPDDWFCDDDERVYCTKLERNIASALRPYEVGKIDTVPEDCPM